MTEQIEKIKKPKGGARPGGGRKLLYGEKTMMVGVVIPISKEKDFWNHIDTIKRQWLNEAKKVS